MTDMTVADFEKTVANPAFLNFQKQLLQLLSPYGYEKNAQFIKKWGISSESFMGYDLLIENRLKDRKILTSYLGDGAVKLKIASSKGYFSFTSFLREALGIDDNSPEYQNSDFERYYLLLLELFAKSLKHQEFEDVIAGRSWRAWSGSK